MDFDQKWFLLHFGRIFRQLIRSPCKANTKTFFRAPDRAGRARAKPPSGGKEGVPRSCRAATIAASGVARASLHLWRPAAPILPASRNGLA
jgi:hypothetical protein